MMDPEENDVEELEAVPSHVFDTPSPPVSGLGGWATGAGSALFAVTKVMIVSKPAVSVAEQLVVCHRMQGCHPRNGRISPKIAPSSVPGANERTAGNPPVRLIDLCRNFGAIVLFFSLRTNMKCSVFSREARQAPKAPGPAAHR